MARGAADPRHRILIRKQLLSLRRLQTRQLALSPVVLLVPWARLRGYPDDRGHKAVDGRLVPWHELLTAGCRACCRLSYKRKQIAHKKGGERWLLRMWVPKAKCGQAFA